MNSTNPEQERINRAAAERLIDRVLDTAAEQSINIREAACYEIGRTKDIELDRLDKVVSLAERKRLAEKVYPGQLSLR